MGFLLQVEIPSFQLRALPCKHSSKSMGAFELGSRLRLKKPGFRIGVLETSLIK
jgi:hypothetical protein